ncbi:MAG TPA: RagB/SusD family nutrient uptake outer membrane protein [Balneolales bacterium]|nr:RagB/SusD family nutrient uptake outer membrane protein [Balneolales bacterium]
MKSNHIANRFVTKRHMNMNRLRIPLMLILSLVLSFSGCDKYLNIQPQDTINQSLALNSARDVENALVGAYSNLGDQYLWGGQLMMEPDLLAATNELTWGGTYQGPRDVFTKNIHVNNGYVASMWEQAYKTINVCNNVLASINKISDSTTKATVQGEAEFIRGSLYFELVKLWGKTYTDGDPNGNMGVPIVLTPTTIITSQNNVSRSSVANVYKQVIKDLNDAKAKLPTSNGFFATTYSASAILSRVYLMMGDYQNALTEANRIIQSGQFSLVKNYMDEFNNGSNTTEDIFDMQVTSQTGINDLHTFYASSSAGDIPNPSRGDITMTQPFMSLFSSTDTRSQQFYLSVDGVSYYTHKYDNPFSNVIVARLAEMYLTRAECNYRLGSSVGATPVADVNKIRERAGLQDLTSITSVDQILTERKKELAFEGHFLEEIKRTHGSVGSIPWNSTKLIFPIPQREMDANKNLVQNNGY